MFQTNPTALNTKRTEIQLVRGLAEPNERLELPCQVDQANCGQVYYITWTKQAANGSQTRVYLYTGANDPSPHKPMGELTSRATFVMPPATGETTNLRRSIGGSLSSSSSSSSVLGPIDGLINSRETTKLLGANQELDGSQLQAKLIIEEPRLTDEALYKCDVTYVKGKCPSITAVKVQMMALPSKAQLFQMPTNNLLQDNQLIGPFSEHEQLQLRCSVTGGRPAPRAVFWRKIDSNGRTVNLKQPVTLSTASKSPTSVEVHLNHTLTNLDLGAKFECHLEHEAMERNWVPPVTLGDVSTTETSLDSMLDLHPAIKVDPDSSGAKTTQNSLDSHVIIDLNVGITSLDLFLTKVSSEGRSFANEIIGRRNASEALVEGDLIEIECVAYNSKPAANITWLNGQDVIGGDSGDVMSTTSTTQTPIGQLQQGRAHLRWLQRHKRLLQRNQVQLNADGQTYNTHSFLSIKLSRNEHRTQISCQAQNAPMQRPLIKSMELQVQHAPIVLMEPAAGIVTNEMVATTGQRDDNVIPAPNAQRQQIGPNPANQRPGEVSIYCIYSAHPSQLVATVATSGEEQNSSVRWFKDGQLIPSSSIVLAQFARPTDHLLESTTATGYPILTIRQPNRRDAGRYDCQVSNAIGWSERLPASESCKVEVNFRPSVQLSLFRVLNENNLRTARNDNYKPDELVEVDLEKELVLPGAHFVLICNIVESQPNKINKFHWYTTTTTSGRYQMTGSGGSRPANKQQQQQQQTLGVSTESEQFKLSPIGANFAPSLFACAASNAIGESGQSNQIDLQLSYAPGQSLVRPVSDALTRKLILASGRPAHPASSAAIGANDDPQQREQQIRPAQTALNAGAELLLECVTQDLGQPRANIWLWFRNGQTVESIPFQANTNSLQQQQQQSQSQLPTPPSTTTTTTANRLGEGLALYSALGGAGQDNPISGGGGGGGRLSPTQEGGHQETPTSNIHTVAQNTRNVRSNARRQTIPGQEEEEEEDPHDHQQGDDNTNRVRDQEATKDKQGGNRNNNQVRPRSLASGRYLFIPSIQLAHKGNYSCVAVNRLGSGPSAPNQSSNERDSYQLRVALAPSFVQPLAARTYWSETHIELKPSNTSTSTATSTATAGETTTTTSSQDNQQLDLVCHVQCEPICQIDWLRNNEPLDLKRQSESPLANYVSHQVRQTLMDENDATNMFKSIESRLTLQFHDIRPSMSMSSSAAAVASASASGLATERHGQKLLMIDRERVLERRQLLNGANYTCQSSSNSMGPAVKSTTKFIVQYPPENVLINTPSDKLNLVEGSNGPRLSCEASGEPRVQFRWMLLRSNNNVITSSDLVAARYKVKHFSLPSPSPSRRQSPLEAIHQLANNNNNNNKQQQHQIGSETTTSLKSPTGSPNDIGQVDSAAAPTIGEPADTSRLVELTGASSEQVGGASSSAAISSLDLSDVSIDRRQSGHYICEASNRLGQTRQSVYVNVLYKPSCTTLHLYSLDMIQMASDEKNSFSSNNNNNNNQEATSTDNDINQTPARPFRATNNDEYSMVRETSEDFIGLRKILIMSPMSNLRHPQQQQLSTRGEEEAEQLSFRGSIFQTILNDKREQLKEKDALFHEDNDLNGDHHLYNQANLLFANDSNHSRLLDLKSGADSWDKFNSLLLKFLNNYMKQVKLNEEQRIRQQDLQQPRDKRQSRRASVNSRIDPGDSNAPPATPYEPSNTSNQNNDVNTMTNLIPGQKNLLTFACLAQDGNPMNNLTFDWTFNSMSLPEIEPKLPMAAAAAAATTNAEPLDVDNLLSSGIESRPIVVYTNENSTLTIQLIRRMDTRTTLNPFQMSLLTLNVIVSSQRSNDKHFAVQANRNSMGAAANHQLKAPVLKNRYQSFYNNALKSNQLDPSLPSGAIHIGHEFDAIKLAANLDLNEHNWQQQLGSLLKCSVSNQIGTSDSCPTVINIQERLNSLGSSSSSSLYEFAKWRMPSLAQKSLLIIGLMVSCMLILFATFALLVGPYLRSLQLAAAGGLAGKRPDPSGHSKDDGTNTGQSTSSQKSSVLGLLGNGDSSFQGSSDDDSTGRLNNHHHNHHLDHNQRVEHNLNNNPIENYTANDNYGTQANGIAAATAAAGRSMMNYDQPRTRMIYQPGNLTDQLSSASYASHYLQGDKDDHDHDHDHDHHHHHHQVTTGSKCASELAPKAAESSSSSSSSSSTSKLGAASGRLLASLRFKSLSKFKVDRIADLPSITGRLNAGGPASLHAKNISNSETTTTGLSINALDTAGQTIQVAGGHHLRSSSSHFGPSNLRHSHHFGRQPPPAPPNYYMYRDTSRLSEQLMQPNNINNNSSLYSNMPTINDEPLNAMDEFLRRRGLTASTGPQFGALDAAYASQTLRNRSALSYSLQQQQQQQQNNDLNHYKPRVRPPVHPRTSQMNPSATMYRPTEVARTSQHLFSPSTLGQATITHGQYTINQQSYANNSFNQTPAPNRLETIDSHLDRLAIDNLALGYHPYTNQMVNNDLHHQMGYANTMEVGSSQYHAGLYNDSQLLASSHNQSAEHIYDVNAYATPEQTPLRRPNSIHNGPQQQQQQQQQQQARILPESERPRVSQLIQSFNSQLPD